MFYAYVDELLTFPKQVPWKRGGRYAEQAFREMPPAQIGVYLRGRSVRQITEDDFSDIVAAGVASALDPNNAERLDIPAEVLGEALVELQPPLAGERNWRIEQVLLNRIVRDASFKSNVYEAYDNRCAVTGLQIIDKKGNPEVHAAHIWAVAQGGPDVVQNGLALSATVRWLFDRYLISLVDDYTLLISDSLRQQGFDTFFAGLSDVIHLPSCQKDRPHAFYIAKHRELFWQNSL